MTTVDLRYERKYPILDEDIEALRLKIMTLPSLFKQTYPRRSIHNVYFDSPKHDAYWENKNGVKNRQKIRIRWYNNDLSTAQLEFKIKRGEVGYKRQYPVLVQDISDLLSPKKCLSKLSASIQTELAALRPTLINHYVRDYYESANHAFRLTLDSNLSFMPVDQSTEVTIDRCHIIEIKYPKTHDDQIHDILTLPYRRQQFSKYVTGIEQLQAKGLSFL